MPLVRADFTTAECVTPDEFEWVASPESGVARMMLDRMGDEVAVATSLVRFAPDSTFSAHDHAFGEEFLVLEGEFADENARHGVLTYVRNPPGSRHTPFSEPGAVILVKLRQFDAADRLEVAVPIDAPLPEQGTRLTVLHRFGPEAVSCLAAASGADCEFPPVGQVQEVFVIDGEFEYQGRRLARWSWLRLPAGQGARLTALNAGRLLHKLRPPVGLEIR